MRFLRNEANLLNYLIGYSSWSNGSCRPPKLIMLDMDSSESPTYGTEEILAQKDNLVLKSRK